MRFTHSVFVALPRWRRAHEQRLVRRNYDALVAAGLDSETMPFGLFFMRYQFQGAFSWMLIVAVLDTLFADGKDDEYAYASLSSLRDTKLDRSVWRLPVFCFFAGTFHLQNCTVACTPGTWFL